MITESIQLTAVDLKSKIHRSGEARHSFTLDENQRVTEYTTKLSTHREINVLGVYHKYLETGN